MSFMHRGIRRRELLAGAASTLALPAVFTGARAQDNKTFVMKLSTATINEAQHEWCKRFAAYVEKDSGGRIKGEIYPASQLGPIPRQIEGTQFGAIQGFIGPPEFLVGIDARYEVMSAPGLVDGFAHANRVATDPEVKKMMFGFGAEKGIHGVGLWVSQPSSIVSRTPIRRLADIKGKKLRVLAAEMQQDMIKRLGASPVAMTLGDVLPAIQQGAIDGALLAVTVNATFHYWDAAKYITETGQPIIFSMAFLSKKWFDGLPKDLQTMVDANADKAAGEVLPWASDFYDAQRKVWTEHGELISLPADEQAAMMKDVLAVGAEVAKRKPGLEAAYKVFADAAKRTAK